MCIGGHAAGAEMVQSSRYRADAQMQVQVRCRGAEEDLDDEMRINQIIPRTRIVVHVLEIE